jgi:two-component system chemotaxis sensor kinase CheA
MDLVGELVLTRNQILQFNAEREDPALNVTSQRLNLITSELQEGVMKTRMQPIGTVWNKLPRVVRDMALALGKQIRLDMDGAGTELDRTIIEAIKDPLVHLVRNACDHGIELPAARTRAGKPPQGRLGLRAYHEGGQVNIEIADDGAGIDVEVLKQKALAQGFLRPEAAALLSEREALNLIFHAGFSTAKALTKISGRGVGMDVVRTNIEKIGGVVDVFSRPGEGVTVKLKIPLTLAIIPGLVVNSGGERFVIPQVSLLELVRLEGDSSEKRVEYVHGAPVYRRRGSLLPVVWLNSVLGLKTAHDGDVVSMVVLQAEDRQFGLVVDGINDTQEIVVKPLGKQLKGVTVYAGATIMGDGRVSLILDVLGIGQRSGVLVESREQTRATAEKKADTGMEMQRLLLFSAGSFHRIAVPLSLVARLEEFPRSAIERAGGHDVVQYRNRILPLVSLRMVLDGEPLDGDVLEGSIPADPAQVIVFNDGDRNLGVEVDQILDIAEEVVTVRRPTSRKGLLGSAVVGKQVADFLDLRCIIEGASSDWFDNKSRPTYNTRILVAEASAFSRGLIRSGLDMAGYGVFEASSVDEALASLERHSVDIVLSALDPLAEAMRKRPEWARIPMLALTENAEREAMLESIARLAEAIEVEAVEERQRQPA